MNILYVEQTKTNTLMLGTEIKSKEMIVATTEKEHMRPLVDSDVDILVLSTSESNENIELQLSKEYDYIICDEILLTKFFSSDNRAIVIFPPDIDINGNICIPIYNRNDFYMMCVTKFKNQKTYIELCIMLAKNSITDTLENTTKYFFSENDIDPKYLTNEMIKHANEQNIISCRKYSNLDNIFLTSDKVLPNKYNFINSKEVIKTFAVLKTSK